MDLIKVHLTMNLVGGQKKSEESELIILTVVSTSEEAIQKSMKFMQLINRAVQLKQCLERL